MKTTPFLLAAVALATPALAQNDECTGAVALTNGTAVAFDTTGATTSSPWPCAGTGGNDIWYSYTTTGAAGDSVTAATCGSGYDTAIEIFSGSCASLVSELCNDDFCGLQSTAAVVSPGAGTQYFIRVGGYNGATGAGTLVVTEAGTPVTPTCTTPDMFEPNTDCGTAASIGDGTYTGLNVNDGDNDYYAVTVAAGSTLNADILFIDAFADTDLYLWDPAVACDTNVAGAGTGTGALAVGFSVTDNETVSYTNTTGAPQNLIIEVDVFTTGGCNDYTLVVSGAGPAGPGSIGTQFCSANPNSTGAVGVCTAFGSTDASMNDVTLTASNLPPAQFGIFVTSATQIPGSPVNAGVLCLGGAVGRYNAPGQILQVDASGEFSLALNLTLTPLPSSVTSVMAGDTRSWQAWHRDIVGMSFSSNFTTGVEIAFN